MTPKKHENFSESKHSLGHLNSSRAEIIVTNANEKTDSIISLRSDKSGSGRRISIADARKKREDDIKERQRRLSLMAPIEVANIKERKLSAGSISSSYSRQSVAITGSQRLDSARRLSATNGNIKNTASKKQLSTKSENKQTHNDLNVDKGNNGIVRPEQDDTRNTDSITRIDVGEQSGYNGGNSCEPGDKQVKTSDSLPLAISDEHIRRGSKNDGESIKISNSWDMSPEDDLKVNFSSKDNVKYKSEKNDRSNVRNEELLIENIEENTHLTEKDQIDRTVIQESNTHIQHKNARKTEFEQTDETSLEQNEERPVEQMDRRSSEQTVIKTQAQDLVQNVLNMAVLQLSKN